MVLSRKQGELFKKENFPSEVINNVDQLGLTKGQLERWQLRVSNYQSKLFNNTNSIPKQGLLFNQHFEEEVHDLDPLKLSPLPLSFWRWPSAPHNGPAIYFVLDRPKSLDSPILLYIGETIAANKRWKGEHDCKAYLAAYSETLVIAEMRSHLSIRFWSDVPRNTTSRRKLELQLIQKWLPPFNKETRNRWTTPFTAQID